MKSFCIQTKKISKYADRELIRNLNFTAYSGEIHGIIGNNGEGKTVFAKLLSGIWPITSGHIFLKGKEIHLDSVASAQKHGIYMLQQEEVLFPALSIRDNIIAGNEYVVNHNKFFSPSRRQMDKICRTYLAKFQLDSLNLDAPVTTLDSYEKLAVQLCRILICNPQVLILDEPSTCLTPKELAQLFSVLEEYKEKTAIILITHRYSVILNHCNRLSVIDKGTVAASFDEEEFTHPAFYRCIEQYRLNFTYPSLPQKPGKERMCIRNLSFHTLTHADFTLHEGEILGLTGLKPDEKDQLFQLLFGRASPENGTITFPLDRKRPYFNLISDRNADLALFADQSIPFNIAVSDFRKIRNRLFTSNQKMRMYGIHYMKQLGVKDADIYSRPVHLSTGTKQKVVIARSLFNQSKIYLYDEPTKNLDSSSKLDLYNILNALAAEGASILLISSDYAELSAMCSRVVLFKDGQQIGNYSTKYLSVEALSKELE